MLIFLLISSSVIFCLSVAKDFVKLKLLQCNMISVTYLTPLYYHIQCCRTSEICCLVLCHLINLTEQESPNVVANISPIAV